MNSPADIPRAKTRPQKRPPILRWKPRRMRVVPHRVEAAAAALGNPAPGECLFVLGAGEWSLIDAIDHLLALAAEPDRPPDLDIAGWTYGRYDCHRLAAMRAAGRIHNLRLVADRSTYEQATGGFRADIERMLGVGTVRCCNNHAKSVIISGRRRSVVIRSSMNLNKNLRVEQADVYVDRDDITSAVGHWFDDLWEACGMADWTQSRVAEYCYDGDDRASLDAAAPAAAATTAARKPGQAPAAAAADLGSLMARGGQKKC